MQITLSRPSGRWPRVLAVCAAAGAALYVLWRPFMQVAGLALGGAGLAFLIAPLAEIYERRLSRPIAALAALASVVIVIGGLLWLALPALIRELGQLTESLPRSVERLSAWAAGIEAWLRERLPGVALPEPKLDGFMKLLPGLATGTVAFAGSAADFISRLSLALMLCFFFLCDRDALLLRLELLAPLKWRAAAVRTGRALSRELRLYLRGQLTIAAAVAGVAAAGLWLAGVRSALVLGGLVGLLNMIPYFGPFIGGVPAVLIALGDGWQRAALCLGVLILTQQVDASILSPRIMGALTGFSPAAVLLAIYAGASLGGVAGLLLALPVLMSARTIFRVFVQNRENI